MDMIALQEPSLQTKWEEAWMLSIAVANHKGGTGKTTSTHNLGVALVGLGWRVLLVDVDPQGSLTAACGITDTEGRSLAEVLGGASPGKIALAEVVREIAPGLAIAPADLALAAVELGLVSRLGRETVLRKALTPAAGSFDVCLIDCPPSLGLLTVGALVAADAVIIPTQPQIVDLRGLRLFLETLTQLQSELNPHLVNLGVLITFYDGRLVHHRQAVEFLRTAELPLLPVMIGRSVRVADASGAGQAVVEADPENPQSQNYRKLAEVIDTWLKSRI